MTLPRGVPGYSMERVWGSAINTVHSPKLLELSALERFVVLSWGAACPQPNAVYENWKQLFPWLINRYDTTNYLSAVIWESASQQNQLLFRQLTSDTPRTSAVGVYEPDMVPAKHLTHLSPMSTLPGYAGSRLNEFWLRRGIVSPMHPYLTTTDLQLVAPDDKIRKPLIEKANDPPELLALMAMAAYKEGFSPQAILEHVLEPEKFMEEKYEQHATEVMEALSRLAHPIMQAILQD